MAGAKATTYKGFTKLAEKLSRLTHFSCEEADALINYYDSLVENGRMDGNKFRDVLHGVFGLTDELMLERVCLVLDRDQDGIIAAEEFVIGLSLILRGTLEEKIEYCFNVYDHNGDGLISREEIFQQLKAAVVNVPPGEEQQDVAKDLVDLVLRRLDDDKDGRVCFKDYAASVHSEPLLLECLGVCLPDGMVRHDFLSMFMEKYAKKSQ